MKKQLSPSMMCADFMNLKETLAVFEQEKIEYLHIDIMDGHFVSNFTLGPDFCRALREQTKIPLDLHLMVERPEEKLDWFSLRVGDLVSVHYESTPHIQRALRLIRERGSKAMLALNPATPLSVLDWLLPDLDGILLMTVNPGFAGQKLIVQCLEKISATRAYLRERGYEEIEIEVDGNVSFENARKMSNAGADIFVAGSSSIFCRELSLTARIERLRASIDK